MLVNSNEILKNASKQGYAIGAYNINNLESARFILESCNEDKAPVILAVSESAVDYFGGYDVVYGVVSTLIKDLNIRVPVVLHLDHGKSFESCKKAINAGFTSVMIDASDKTLEDNIEITKMVMSYAEPRGISVEAELGSLNGTVSTVDDCVSFVSETNINSLAPSVGNKHGVYKEEPNIDYKLLGTICKKVKLPLVLHGSSGLDENKLKTAVFCGVCKININTDLQIAWSKGVREVLEKDPNLYDLRQINKSGEAFLKKRVHEINRIIGSNKRAF